MSYNNSPRIVTDGLVLCLDASNPKSYPGVGNIWTNLAGNSITSTTLINGTGHSSINYGSIRFDGINDYVNCGNSTLLQINAGTIMTYIKIPVANIGFRGIIGKYENYGLFINNGNLAVYDWGNATGRSSTVNIVDNLWHHICMTFSDNTGNPVNNVNIYLDGILVYTTTLRFVSNSTGLIIGRLGTTSLISSFYLNGYMALAHLYNRVLSYNEIIQNFNTIKSKYQN